MAENTTDDRILSLQEVIEEEESLEATANAVLGPGDDQNCTYPEGYMQRQALFACSTCLESSGRLAGVCLACSLACHDGHELYELYTKRLFRCDCGNGRFSAGFECLLCPEKLPQNEKNKYNHNFRGLYCKCRRPYPDPERESEEEDMIQCSICEDWLHGNHLGEPPPPEYEEMVCDGCMQRHSFLVLYQMGRVEQQTAVDVETVVEGDALLKAGESGGERRNLEDSAGQEDVKRNEDDKAADCTESSSNQEKGFPSDQNEVSLKGQKDVSKNEVEKTKEDPAARLKKEKCTLRDTFSPSVMDSSGPGYFLQGWRASLCRCSYCKDLYSCSGLQHLLDPGDPVAAYEAQSEPCQPQSSLQSGLEAFRTNLDHVQQTEALYQYGELSSELKDYLKSFADQGKVVRKEDIEDFFETMTRKKRRKIEEGLEGMASQHCHF